MYKCSILSGRLVTFRCSMHPTKATFTAMYVIVHFCISSFGTKGNQVHFCTCTCDKEMCVYMYVPCEQIITFFSCVRWLPSYVCIVNARKNHAFDMLHIHCTRQYIQISLIRLPRRSGYFWVKRMCAVKRGLTVLQCTVDRRTE